MSTASTVYSIGSALHRAHDLAVEVEVLVAGTWARGEVVALDAHSLLLATGDEEHLVARMDAVDATRVLSPCPGRARSPVPAQRPG